MDVERRQTSGRRHLLRSTSVELHASFLSCSMIALQGLTPVAAFVHCSTAVRIATIVLLCMPRRFLRNASEVERIDLWTDTVLCRSWYRCEEITIKLVSCCVGTYHTCSYIYLEPLVSWSHLHTPIIYRKFFVSLTTSVVL